MKPIPLLILLLVLVRYYSLSTLHAQPQPGDVFREYLWTNEGGDAGGSLRVGGRVGYGGGPIALPHEFDLKNATHAQVVIEKLLCHDGTHGLGISVNSNDWVTIPEATGIAEPQCDYQHHIYPVVSVPLSHLRVRNNQFRMKVSAEHSWKWPQNLIYGVHVRIYYDPANKPHPTGRLISLRTGDVLGSNVKLTVDVNSPYERLRQVDFLGCFEDVNLEGDGHYTQWHYHYVRAKLAGHIGTVNQSPWSMTWNTSWIPDQSKPFRMAARITDETGLTYFTEAVEKLALKRDGLSVELCKPFDIPKKWVTRSGEKTQKFRITGDLNKAIAAQLVWVSWSPGYMEGIYINGKKVLAREGPRYAYFAHRIPLEDLNVFRPGENVLLTGKTPKYHGKMVHGMEVNWPGIMVLIQYRD